MYKFLDITESVVVYKKGKQDGARKNSLLVENLVSLGEDDEDSSATGRDSHGNNPNDGIRATGVIKNETGEENTNDAGNGGEGVGDAHERTSVLGTNVDVIGTITGRNEAANAHGEGEESDGESTLFVGFDESGDESQAKNSACGTDHLPNSANPNDGDVEFVDGNVGEFAGEYGNDGHRRIRNQPIRARIVMQRL